VVFPLADQIHQSVGQSTPPIHLFMAAVEFMIANGVAPGLKDIAHVARSAKRETFIWTDENGDDKVRQLHPGFPVFRI
jgi:hypothetical protein